MVEFSNDGDPPRDYVRETSESVAQDAAKRKAHGQGSTFAIEVPRASVDAVAIDVVLDEVAQAGHDAQVDYVRALANQIAYGCTAPQDKIFSVVRYLATGSLGPVVGTKTGRER